MNALKQPLLFWAGAGFLLHEVQVAWPSGFERWSVNPRGAPPGGGCQQLSFYQLHSGAAAAAFHLN